jgi:hypothetical protein
VRCFTGAAELLAAVDVDAVVVATPTPTHDAVIAEVRQHWGGRIVVEKPPPAAVLDDAGVEVVYHAAFATEVAWAVERLPAWVAAHGPVAAVEQRWADAYADDLARATAVLGDSWLDGGSNALSVLARLAEPEARSGLRAVDGLASTFEAAIDCGLFEATVVTTWAAAEPSKTTRVTFADGATLVLDHQAVLGQLGDDWFARPGPPARLVQHYVGCYERLFVEGRRCFPVATDRRLHRLLRGG